MTQDEYTALVAETEGHTPGPWRVRHFVDYDGNPERHFVCADDVNGFHYDACILEDDEYREENKAGNKMPGPARRKADAHIVAAAPALLEAVGELMAKNERLERGLIAAQAISCSSFDSEQERLAQIERVTTATLRGDAP
jgi:hypothetical protein